jgi:hypothetical protein
MAKLPIIISSFETVRVVSPEVLDVQDAPPKITTVEDITALFFPCHRNKVRRFVNCPSKQEFLSEMPINLASNANDGVL